MSIKNLTWDGTDRVLWSLDDGGRAERRWKLRPQSVTLLRDLSGFLVVESINESGAGNLVIVNANGTERFRPRPPTVPGSTYGFAYGGYEGDRLVVVVASVGGDLAMEVDPQSGRLTDRGPRM
jgi:hypothetical protein